MPITVLLTDDKEVVRSSIGLYLIRTQTSTRLEKHSSLRKRFTATELKPQIVVMDLDMPYSSSVELRISNHFEHIRVATDRNLFLER